MPSNGKKKFATSRKNTFAEAIAGSATAYAYQTERDYQALLEKVKSGQGAAEIE